MTVDEQQSVPADPGSADRSQLALDRHARSLRRQRRWYAGSIGAVAVVIAAALTVVWSRSEIAHVHLRTAKAAAPDVANAPLATRPTLTWRNGDTAAIGQPFAGGTVVTYSKHTVTGRNALTGAAVWTYERTDRTVCAVAQIENKTIALYFNGPNCDEVTALDTGTGKRQWVRTLDENGQPIDGTPTVRASGDTLFVSSQRYLYAIEPISSYDRWIFGASAGCTINSYAAGTGGVLISQHCAGGDELALRDAFKNDDDKQTSDDKKHQIRWRAKNTSAVPLVADSFIGALDRSTGSLVTYEAASGRSNGRVALSPAPTSTNSVKQVAAEDGELVWIDGRCYAFTDRTARLMWTAALPDLPTLSWATTGTGPPPLNEALVLVPSASGVDALDGQTGRVRTSYPLPAATTGSRIYHLGTGFLIAGTSSTEVYE